jgi:hypothetical protein
MSFRNLAAIVLGVLVCGGSVSAQSKTETQFPKTMHGDTEYNWLHGRDTPRSAAQIDNGGYWGSIPYVLLFIAGACAAEKIRQRRRENEWQRAHRADASYAPLATLPDTSRAPVFQPLTAADMINFTRPSAAARAADPTLRLDLADISWQRPQAAPAARRATSTASAL